MQTDELITLLAKTPRPKPPLRWAAALAVLVAAITALNVAILGFRPDIATPPASMALKSFLLLGLLGVAGIALARAARPVEATRGGWVPALVLAALLAATLAWEWSHVPAAIILYNFSLPNFPFCLGAVTIYGSLAAAVLTWIMRTYAPANEARAAAAIGFAAAAAGAVGYSVHCPVDSPTFVVIAYGLPVSWVTLAGRTLLARHIRW
jgi:hypothetical protein